MTDDLFDDDFTTSEANRTAPRRKPTTESLLAEAVEVVSSGRAMPLSSSVMVARDELLAILEEARDVLPSELRDARWLLRERDEFLAARQREADKLMEDVRAQAERMVQRTEIVRQANQVAQRILDSARAEARRLRHEAEDYCDQKLAAFEIVLDRTLRTVRAGREKLQVVPLAPGTVAGADEQDEDGEGASAEDLFFDQDLS